VPARRGLLLVSREVGALTNLLGLSIDGPMAHKAQLCDDLPSDDEEGNRVATLSGLILTLRQTDAQKTLQTVGVTYGYTLTCTEIECERNVSFDVSVDIMGDDVVRDEVLADGVDRHIVECDRLPIEMRRTFVVGQSLLNEDVGTDEIKLRVRVRDSAGGETSAFTGIVQGNF
jgi:hypothetical protein